MHQSLPIQLFGLINTALYRVKPTRQIRRFIVMAVVMLSALTGMAQTTFTTKAPGNWSNPATWDRGVVPTHTIAAGSTVNIMHNVVFDLTDDLQVYGNLYITGDTLRFPTTFTKKTYVQPAGFIRILNGGFMQDLTANQCEVEIKGGRFFAENAVVNIGRHFKNIDGRRTLRNSWIKVGETYEVDGSSSLPARDSIQYSTLEVNVSNAGHLEIKDDSYLGVSNARIFVHNGDFKTANRAYIHTLPNTASGYGFDLIKAFTHLDVNGPWNAKIYTHCIDGDIKGSNVSDIDFVRAEDCTLAPPPPASPSGQMVINEVYTDPADGKHEFMELYNINNQPEQMNNYTLVTNFNDGVQKGFYVLDFPNLVVPAKGFFVASADFPMSYQGLTNSINSSFSWNNINTNQEASLKKWLYTGGTGNLTDGNINYDVAPLPSTGLNDLLYRISGDISYTFLMYKNGILVSRIIAGAGGQSSLSSSLTTMPTLFIDMAGSSPDFSINFSKYAGMAVEKITSDAGNDNGFTRASDGSCGTFRKSSNATQHSPLQSNGPAPLNAMGQLNIVSSYTTGTPDDGSTFTYTVSGITSLFPAEVRVYADNGTVPGQFDIEDELIETNSATFSGQTLVTRIKPYDANAILVSKQGAGCIDQVQMVAPTDSRFITLPVNFTHFTAAYQQDAVQLSWSTEASADLTHFIVQRSLDGKNFSDLGLVFSTEKVGTRYGWKDKTVLQSVPVYYYRIKAVSAKEKSTYSTIRVIKPGTSSAMELVLQVFPNPVKDKMNVSFPSAWKDKAVRYELYNANGSLLRAGSIVNNSQFVVMEMANLPQGIYLIKAVSGTETVQQRIIKQ